MIDLGYMAKRIMIRPDWLEVPSVRDIYSVCNCMSEDFCDYVLHWKHNGFWFFDSPELIRAVAAESDVCHSDTALLFFQGYDLQFDADRNAWTDYAFRS